MCVNEKNHPHLYEPYANNLFKILIYQINIPLLCTAQQTLFAYMMNGGAE